jgi:hypothetical protein
VTRRGQLAPARGYLTLVYDLERGRLVWVGANRDTATMQACPTASLTIRETKAPTERLPQGCRRTAWMFCTEPKCLPAASR